MNNITTVEFYYAFNSDNKAVCFLYLLVNLLASRTEL